MDSAIESNGLRKAAILMVMLGEDTATKIYHNLAEQDLQSLTQEIAELEYIAPEMALRVLEEYYRLSMTQDCLVQGGSDYARKLLVASFGEEAAQHLLNQVWHTAGMSVSKLDSLQKSDPQQLAKFLEFPSR